jgi:hypothetical protein
MIVATWSESGEKLTLSFSHISRKYLIKKVGHLAGIHYQKVDSQKQGELKEIIFYGVQNNTCAWILVQALQSAVVEKISFSVS